MYVTLNISNSSIRILAVKGRQVNKWGSTDLKAGLVRDGFIMQPEAVGEVIDALFKSTGIPKEKVITSLSGLSFTYRFISLPKMKSGLLEEAIQRAAKKEISLPLNELYLCWQPVPGSEDEQSFFVLGVSRHLVDAMIQTLRVAGVEPYLMDLQPLALARAANRSNAIVTNLEPECYDIVIITDGLPTVIHTISPRGEGATLDDNIHRLADELTKTVAFYQSSHPKNHLGPATPLLLTGLLATEVTTQGLLQSEIEYPIEPLIPALEFSSDLPVASYAASMGLALKKIPQKPAGKGDKVYFHDIDINILSGKFRKPKAPLVPRRYVVLWALLLIAVALIYPLYQGKSQLGVKNTELESRLNEASRELNLATLVAEETTLKEDTITEITASTENLTMINQSLLSTRGDFTDDFQLVSSALPPELYLTSVEIDRYLVKVQGETENVFAVIDYATTLETLEAFSEVRITELDETFVTINETDNSKAIQEDISIITFEILIKKSVSRNIERQ
jgi:type IV pilus assembly protein PilM